MSWTDDQTLESGQAGVALAPALSLIVVLDPLAGASSENSTRRTGIA